MEHKPYVQYKGDNTCVNLQHIFWARGGSNSCIPVGQHNIWEPIFTCLTWKVFQNLNPSCMCKDGIMYQNDLGYISYMIKSLESLARKHVESCLRRPIAVHTDLATLRLWKGVLLIVFTLALADATWLPSWHAGLQNASTLIFDDCIALQFVKGWRVTTVIFLSARALDSTTRSKSRTNQ